MQERTFGVALVATVMLLFAAGSAGAAKKWFHCRSVDECEVTQENRVGPLFSSGDARASKKAAERVASVCIAAGFSHYQVIEEDQRSGKHGSYFKAMQKASHTIRAKFLHEEVEGSYSCAFSANEDYIKRAKKIAAKNGYPWPVERDPDTE